MISGWLIYGRRNLNQRIRFLGTTFCSLIRTRMCAKRVQFSFRNVAKMSNTDKWKWRLYSECIVVYHRPMNIPEGTLLTVEDFAFELIAFLVNTWLSLCLHKDELPLPREHLLKTGEVLCFVVGQLETRFVLHRPLAQVDGVVRVFRLPAIARPKIRGL